MNNLHLHPRFQEIFDRIFPPVRTPMPAAMPADVAERLSDVRETPPEQFAEYDEEHLRQIVPERLVKPLQDLMLARMQINAAARIEALNKDKALEWLRKDTEAIYEALKDLWSEL